MCLFFLLTSIVNGARCNRTPNYASPTSCNGSPQSWQALSRNNASKMPIMQRKSTHSPLRIAAHPKLTAVNGRETSFVPTFHITSVAVTANFFRQRSTHFPASLLCPPHGPISLLAVPFTLLSHTAPSHH